MMQVNSLGDSSYIKKTIAIILSFILCFSFSLGYIFLIGGQQTAYAYSVSQKTIYIQINNSIDTPYIWYDLGANAKVRYESENNSIVDVKGYSGFSLGDGAYEFHYATIKALRVGDTVVKAIDKWGRLVGYYTIIVHKGISSKPTLASNTFQYTGKEIKGLINGSNPSCYTIKHNAVPLNVGEYKVTVSLYNKNNYEWSDGTTDDLCFTYRITKAPSSLEAKLNAKSIKASKVYKQYVPIIINKNIKKLSVKVSNKKIKIDKNDCLVIPKGFSGNITVTIKDKGDKNHYSKAITLKLKVKKK